ncbi:MAG TPA: thioesterase [Phaeodactylibacter sp.]|nr:thioesterase [Phaeodactylibacter sp.]
MKKIEQALAAFPVRESIIVQWGDMDAARHVNNVIYLRWAETSRIAYFNALGNEVSPDMGGAGFILGWQDCKYIFPVTYPDTVHMGIRMIGMGEDRFVLETHFFSEKHDRIVAISKQRVVTYDYKTLQKVPLPEKLKEKILEMEEK